MSAESDDSESPPPPTKSFVSRFRWRFSLSALLGLILIVAIGLAWFRAQDVHYRRQAEARLRIEGAGSWCNEKPVRFGELGRMLGKDDWRTTDTVEFSPGYRTIRTHGAALTVSTVNDELLAEIRAFPELKRLMVPSNTDITGQGLAVIGEMHALESLIIRVAALQPGDLRFLRALKQLSVLKLEGIDLGDDDLKYLAELRELEELSLTGNPRLEGAGFIQLRQLSKLKLLHLSQTAVRDQHLQHLTPFHELWGLRLNGSPVTGVGLGGMKDLPLLTHLKLSDCPLSEEGMAAVGELTHLLSIDLQNTPLTDAGLAQLDGLHQLKYLGAKGTKITKVGAEQFLRMHPNARLDWEPEK